jgi:hypothetical protein
MPPIDAMRNARQFAPRVKQTLPRWFLTAALPATEQDRVASQIRKLIETSPDLASKSEVTFTYETAAFSCVKLG